MMSQVHIWFAASFSRIRCSYKMPRIQIWLYYFVCKTSAEMNPQWSNATRPKDAKSAYQPTILMSLVKLCKVQVAACCSRVYLFNSWNQILKQQYVTEAIRSSQNLMLDSVLSSHILNPIVNFYIESMIFRAFRYQPFLFNETNAV